MRCVHLLDSEQFLIPWDHIEHCYPHFLFHTYIHEVLVFFFFFIIATTKTQLCKDMTSSKGM